MGNVIYVMYVINKIAPDVSHRHFKNNIILFSNNDFKYNIHYLIGSLTIKKYIVKL